MELCPFFPHLAPDPPPHSVGVGEVRRSQWKVWGYPLCFRASTTCSCSLWRLSCVVIIPFALSNRHLTSPLFTCTGWCEHGLAVHCDVEATIIIPLHQGVKEGEGSILLSSTVNCIAGCIPLRWSRSFVTAPLFTMQHMSSKCCFNNRGLTSLLPRLGPQKTPDTSLPLWKRLGNPLLLLPTAHRILHHSWSTVQLIQ